MTTQPPVRADSAFLHEVLASLAHRRKALKHRNIAPAIDRIIEVTDGEPIERIKITFRKRPHQTLTLIVWGNRNVWMHACEAIKNAGWAFQHASSGRLLGSIDAAHLVEAVEASLSAMFGMASENTHRLEAIWSRLLASGPPPRLRLAHPVCEAIHCSTTGAIRLRHLEPLKMP